MADQDSEGANVGTVAAELMAEINAAYGLFLDANAGFDELRSRLENAQQVGPDSTGDSPVYYGFGAPGEPGNVLLHKTTAATLRGRISEGGRHYFLMARMLIVLLYALWETGYRAKLAAAIGVAFNDLQVSVFGDLRDLRNDILHNKGRLEENTLRGLEVVPVPVTKTADYYKRDVHGIIRQIQWAVDELVIQHAGYDPAFRTVWSVS